MAVRELPDSRVGGLAACAVGLKMDMPPERPLDQHSRREVQQSSESDGGLLVPALMFIVGTVVGWGAYLFAMLAVLSYPTDVEAVSVAGLSMSTTFWISVGLLAIIVFAMLVKPGTILAGWLLMAGVVAVAASYGVGWSTGIILIEGLTLGFAAIATFVKIVLMMPDWVIYAHALNKRGR